MGIKTYNSDVDIEGIIQTDKYIQQDSIRADIKDEDWEDITDWNDSKAGTATVEESPAGQLHLLAGDGAGANSYAKKTKTFNKLTNIYAYTIQLKVKFDALAGGFNGTSDTYDCFQIQSYNGTYRHNMMITSDSVWLYDSTNAFVSQFGTTFDNVSWYTIRIVWFGDEFIMYSRDDDGAWARNGAGDDADPNIASNGNIRIGVINFPVSPATTEAHVEYIKISAGALFPK